MIPAHQESTPAHSSVRLVILDRDGVINHDSDDYIKNADEWLPIKGSIEAIAQLSRSGYKVAVATNQSGVARNYFTIETLDLIHHKMCSMVKEAGGSIDRVFYCPHGPDDNCDCRKPMTGLLKQISDYFHAPLEGVPFVGDSSKDIIAARACDCRPILVKTGKGKKTLEDANEKMLRGVTVVNDLVAAVDFITGGDSQ